MNNFEPITFGKYLLLERIGIGGMAEIFKAKTFGMSGFEKILVIKRILPKYGRDKEFRDMFINEAKLTSSLLHNNVIQIFDLGEIDGQYFIAMEYIKGTDLLHLLRKHSERKKYISFEVIIFILKEIFSGLGYAHSAKSSSGNPLNIVHRDVSPSNILLSYDGDIKVSDFGIAKTNAKSLGKDTTQQFKGKLGYMSPEQVLGEKLDGRSDIFAAGIIAFEAITLRRLFQGSSNLEILNNITSSDKIDILKYRKIPRELAIVINKILSKKPEDRFVNSEQVVEALDEVAYRNNLRMTRSKFSAYLKELFKEEIKKSTEIKEGATSYVYIPPKKGAENATYIPKIDKSSKRIVLESGVYVLTDLEDNYYMNDGKNPVDGPFTLGKISNMIKNEELKGYEFFSRDKKDFKSLESFPEIKALFSMHSSAQKLDSKLVFSTTLKKQSFVRILYNIYIKKDKGLLKLSNIHGVNKEIIFKNGSPIFVRSNKKSELFGNFLLKEGKITKEKLKEVIENDNHNRLGEAIIAQKILQPYEVFELLTKQVKTKLYDIFSWNDGGVEFYNEYKMVDIAVPLNIKFEELVVQGIIKYSPEDKFRKIFEKRSMLKIIKLDSNFNLLSLKLQPIYLRVLKNIQYNETIGVNIQALKSESSKIILYQLLYFLFEIKYIKFSK